MVILIRIIVASSSRSTVSLLARDVLLNNIAKTANRQLCSRFLFSLSTRERTPLLSARSPTFVFVCYMAVVSMQYELRLVAHAPIPGPSLYYRNRRRLHRRRRCEFVSLFDSYLIRFTVIYNVQRILGRRVYPASLFLGEIL